MTISADPFWDGQTGGNVRCSMDGAAASQYQDPSTQFFEGNGGRSIASLLPGSSRGLRGVVIPRATTFGGSRGFDPHKPRLMNIDPDIKGQSCVVDLSKITKESMEEAFIEAAQNPVAASDIRLLAAQTFHNLAVGYEPVGMGPSRGPRLVERRSPLGDFGAYVVPSAGLGGGQVFEAPAQERPSSPEENISPSVTPRTGPAIDPDILKRAGMNRPFQTNQNPRDMASNVGMPAPPMRMTDENGNPINGAEMEAPLDGYQIERKTEPPTRQKQGFVDQSPPQMQAPPRKVKLAGPPPGTQERAPAQQSAPVGPPETRVTFEIEGWGEFEAMYHEVIKNDCVLVLVFDTRFKGGGKYFPPATDKLMAVKVDGQQNVYFVNSYGTRFQHGGYEYCMLVIDQDNEVTE
jgi:hypothetical protein